jgi:tRNA 5-methylaminomethyl-2-thiouridine biosynthesis bifunctional protein
LKEINKLIFQSDATTSSSVLDDEHLDKKSFYQQREQVFLNSNNIYKRLLNNQSNFTIVETSFGIGLNFLSTLLTYQKALQKNKSIGKLTFISIEKHPISKEQLTKAIQQHPQFECLLTDVIKQYPETPKQYHQPIELSFYGNKVTLKIIFNDIEKSLFQLSDRVFKKPHKNKEGSVDVWYLNNLIADLNLDNLPLSLFQHIAQLSKEQTTLSATNMTNPVKEQLINLGFRIKNITTLNQKESTLIGIFQQNPETNKGYQLRPNIQKPKQVTIIGGGIASACAAYALTKKGIKVQLYCKDDATAKGASSNITGALFPLIHQQKDDISIFYETAFWRARELYDELLNKGHHFSHDWCGLLEISYKDALLKRQKIFEKNQVWSTELITSINAEQASKYANITLSQGGLFMPSAGWISPPELVTALLKAAKATDLLVIETSVNVEKIVQIDENNKHSDEPLHWQLFTNQGIKETNTLIVCGGAETAKLNIVNQLPLSAVRGQISNMKANNALSKLTTVICHKGYLTPMNKNVQCIGATFDKNSFDIETKATDDDYNLAMLTQCLPSLPQWQKSDVLSSKARLRCMTPDHLPVVGVMPDIKNHQTTYDHLAKDKNWKYPQPAPSIKHLYVLTGLGARGLCTAPLLADILTADLTGEPYPIDNQMLFNLSPNRFVIRDLIKRKIKRL